MSLEFREISSGNLEDIVNLLQERNGTLPEYTRLKYRGSGVQRFRGVIAYSSGQPIGCFGVMPQSVLAENGFEIACGWFSDWYVSEKWRSRGLGKELLVQISNHYPITFGHPGPERAYNLCLNNGYIPLEYQFRYQMVFRRWDYARTRRRTQLEAASSMIKGYVRSIYGRLTSKSRGAETESIPEGLPQVRICNNDEYLSWLKEQPVANGNNRAIGTYKGKRGLETLFMDDVLSTGERRRRVLFCTVAASIADWVSFFSQAKSERCTYAEIFTTDKITAAIWASCGAWMIDERRIVVKGLSANHSNILIQGADRENWTFLAATRGSK